jgi:N-acylneuraminate cytidylyltransferase
MKVVALIPARGGSKRIPKKNLYPILGVPLIEWSIRTCLRASLDEVWVSSDDKEILEFCRNIDKVKVIKRPEYLSRDNSSTDDVMVHFASEVEFDALVLVQSTSPLVRSEDINKGIDLIFSGKYDSVFSAISAKENDILFWKVSDKAIPVNFDPMKRGLSQTRENPYFIETGAFYIILKDVLLELKSRYGRRLGLCEVPLYTMFEIDNMEDIPIVEHLLKIKQMTSKLT